MKIALKFSYIGTNYAGLVVQTNEVNTVEQHILHSLRKVCLINPEETTSFSCSFNRCGRTDKGVSALANVCSLLIRKLPNLDYV